MPTTMSKPQHTLPRTPVIVGVLVGAIVVVALVALALSKTGHSSQYLTIEKDVSGQVVKVSGDAIALRTSDGQVNTRLLNPSDFQLHPGDRVNGTLVQIPLLHGDGSEEALIVYSAIGLTATG